MNATASSMASSTEETSKVEAAKHLSSFKFELCVAKEILRQVD
jgi:hypothetical protein